MADGKLSNVFRRMRTLEQVRVLRGQDDCVLLEQFIAHNSEAAFEVLVQRHGPMVLGVCRRILANNHDAEDAFQAVFLVLARRAAAIRNPDAVGPWLHGVACKIAVRARKTRGLRNRMQVTTGIDIGQFQDGAESSSLEWRDLGPVFDEELGRLPEKYRTVVVLCYLEELSNADAAKQLGWPIGTVKGRLARARMLLQVRLTRRGVALAGGLLALAVGSPAALRAAAPRDLEISTISQALQIATGATPAAAGATPAVAALYNGGLQTMMRVAKVKSTGALLALLGVCAFSGTFTYRALAGRETVGSAAVHAAPVRLARAPAPKDKTKKPAEAGSTEPAGVPLAARLIGAKDSYTLDLGGLSAEDFHKQIENFAKAPRLPVGGPRHPDTPKVDLKLELTNTGKEELKVRVRGNINNLKLDLKGPGVVNVPLLSRRLLANRQPPEILTLAPGKTVTLSEIPTLEFLKTAGTTKVYWTARGQYTLTVDYNLEVSPAPDKTGDASDGFGRVTVHSAPIQLNVVEAKK
jgi:RNA polymerase sigma factor (sigma-70 family)